MASDDSSRQRESLLSSGLTGSEARRRQLQFGENELPRAPRRGVARIVVGVFSEPMFLLLAVAAVIYLAVGGIGEGLLMAGFAGLSILLVVVQETRSENAIEALRALATPMARVVRDGHEQRLAAREVVPGDILLIADGERVAADAVLRRAENIAADESLLTGESVPVLKGVCPQDEECTEADATGALLYASTLVTSGRGIAEVIRTGANTEAGRIGVSLASIETEPTLLQRSFGRLVRLFAILAFGASVVTVLLYGLLRGSWLQGVLSGIALGMSAVPEEFPMVLAVFVALGARRLTRLHVLARRTAVIEMLGACSTLCVDKTGTLTENRMQVCGLSTLRDRIELRADTHELPATFADLVRIAARASARTSNDPMDLAVHRLAEAIGNRDRVLQANASPLREYGLTHEQPAVVRVWTDNAERQAVAKGAPECIAGLCGLDDRQHAQLLQEVERYAQNGIRVLALAACELGDGILPATPRELGLKLRGLIAFADPLRQSARQAVADAQRAGVTVVMMTGDYPTTALAVARDVGIDCRTPPITGAQIAAADDTRLREWVKTTRVFARIRPDQKLRIVRALKDNGEVVAMTGDGVNDAPALKAAHIGLAMGSRGTDVAREASSVVLMEDDLTHLIAGIEMGRRIFDNLRKASIYIAAIHIPVAGLTLLPLVLGLPPLLLPLHVVLIEMVIDPMCAIAFENEPAEPGTMEQPPRRADDVLMGWPQFGVALVQGLLLFAASFAIYVAALAMALDAAAARALAFIGFTAGNLMLIRVSATRGSTIANLGAADHSAYWIVAALAVIVTAACVFVPVLQRLFDFAAPAPGLVILAIAAGLLSALAFDLVKWRADVQRILGRSIRPT